MNSLDATLQTLSSWMAGASETLSIILNQGCYPEPARHELLTTEQLGSKGWSGLAFGVGLFGGLEGELQLLLGKQHAHTLVDLLVGSPGEQGDEFTELHQNVLHEAIQQLISSLADQLTQLKGQPVKVRLSQATPQLRLDGVVSRHLWWECPITLDEGEGFSFIVVGPESFMEQLSPSSSPAKSAPRQRSGLLSALEPVDEDSSSGSVPAVEKPRFSELKPGGEPRGKGQLDLILDVPLQVQVVLGRTSMMVQDLIHLGEGSILELDKLAGEPVELFVNDRLVAFGEVIVVDERFGVKVLELAREKRPLRVASSF